MHLVNAELEFSGVFLRGLQLVPVRGDLGVALSQAPHEGRLLLLQLAFYVLKYMGTLSLLKDDILTSIPENG